jgi:catechol 2,3-dioxygenase-like lactoylglutathione lyase family enzyme
MLKQLTTTQVWVHDQDEALAFYTDKLGLELREDVTVPELGNFRWLTVGVPGQPDIAITLMAIPGPPVFDEETQNATRRSSPRASRAVSSSPPTTSSRRTRS